MTQQEKKHIGMQRMAEWRADWNKFAYDMLGARLDREQQQILSLVQENSRVSVMSGTARGKDYVSACAAVCFFLLTPRWDREKQLVKNTKVALTAPTDRQVKNVMMPEISRLWNTGVKRGFNIGQLLTSGIKTGHEEWFLTGFKADEHNPEAWSGFHAANTMFVVTEASGVSDDIFNAIEGNLQGNSRILLVFNPNRTIGYAAATQMSPKWKSMSLNSLNAENVVSKQEKFIGQVDYQWVKDRVDMWCAPIRESEVSEKENDFEFEGLWYRPDDLFRVKVLGVFPKVSEGMLISPNEIQQAQERDVPEQKSERRVLGVDVAGMGKDSTCYIDRQGYQINFIDKHNSGGKADHMGTAGYIADWLNRNPDGVVSIDTIGEGAGVYSRLVELGYEDRVISCKYSEAAKDDNGNDLTDSTGQRKFANMRAYLFWCVREWIGKANIPKNNSKLGEEATQIKWWFRSNGSIIMEPKEDIKKRLGRSPDEFDTLANTFAPIPDFEDMNFDEDYYQNLEDLY